MLLFDKKYRGFYDLLYKRLATSLVQYYKFISGLLRLDLCKARNDDNILFR